MPTCKLLSLTCTAVVREEGIREELGTRAYSFNPVLVSHVWLAAALSFPKSPDNCQKYTEKKTSKPVLCIHLFLRAAKECELEANLANTRDKIILAQTTGMEPCSALQFCDECKMYADYDSLPPCFCDTNEGL